MVATIFAAVRGDRSRLRMRVAGWHQIGLVTGALVLTIPAALAGAALAVPASLVAVAAILMLVWGMAILAGRPLPVRSPSAQVPLAWRYTMSPGQYAFSYGVGLGIGVVTRVASGSLYALLAVVVFDGRVATGLAAAAAYSLGRGLPVLYASGSSSPEEAMGSLERIRALATRADGVALLAGGVIVLAPIVQAAARL